MKKIIKYYIWILIIVLIVIVGFYLFKINTKVDTSNTGDKKTEGQTSPIITNEKYIEIRYLSALPGKGYGVDYYIINNSGRYIWTSRSGYGIKFEEEIQYDTLLSLYNEIEDKGFFGWDGDYSSMAKDYTGGSLTEISMSGDGKNKTVKVFGTFGPSAYYEIASLISSYYPEKKNCSLKNQEDFPTTNLSEYGPNFPKEYVCPDPYYTRYYDYCVCT